MQTEYEELWPSSSDSDEEVSSHVNGPEEISMPVQQFNIFVICP